MSSSLKAKLGKSFPSPGVISASVTLGSKKHHISFTLCWKGNQRTEKFELKIDFSLYVTESSKRLMLSVLSNAARIRLK